MIRGFLFILFLYVLLVWLITPISIRRIRTC